MKIIRMEIELEYDEGIMHSDDQQAVDWFMNEVMGGELVLHSNELGDSVGIVKVLKHLPTPNAQRHMQRAKIRNDAKLTHSHG